MTYSYTGCFTKLASLYSLFFFIILQMYIMMIIIIIMSIFIFQTGRVQNDQVFLIWWGIGLVKEVQT